MLMPQAALGKSVGFTVWRVFCGGTVKILMQRAQIALGKSVGFTVWRIFLWRNGETWEIEPPETGIFSPFALPMTFATVKTSMQKQQPAPQKTVIFTVQAHFLWQNGEKHGCSAFVEARA